MVTLVVVTPATLAVIGNTGGQVSVGEGVGVAVGVGSVVPLAPPQTASATVVTARNMRSIGTSGGCRAPLTEGVAGAVLRIRSPTRTARHG